MAGLDEYQAGRDAEINALLVDGPGWAPWMQGGGYWTPRMPVIDPIEGGAYRGGEF